MASPTVSLESRELPSSDAFGRYLPSPTCLTPNEFERFAKVSGLRRGGPSSSLRVSRREEIRQELGFRERKTSGNFASELNESDIDYRHSMSERTRRIFALRSEFLRSTLREPDAFRRAGTRASMPATAYQVREVGVHKFPFAEPSTTARTVAVDGTTEVDGVIEEKAAPRAPDSDKPKDPKELYKELMMRYSPQPKPVDMKLPPTRPKVVSAISKQSRVENSQVFENDESKISDKETEKSKNKQINSDMAKDIDNCQRNMLEQRSSNDVKGNGDTKESTDESSERHDRVPEIPNISKPGPVLKNSNATLDDSIPTLLEKISKDAPPDPEANGKKKTKRKRTFLDKLLNRNRN